MNPREQSAAERCEQIPDDCMREVARNHGDEAYLEMACTCSECQNLEDACAFLDDLQRQHHDLEDQWRWYTIVELFGATLPEPVWRHVEAEMRVWQAADVEQAEMRAGWDPNP